jgi:hypothetical protein
MRQGIAVFTIKNRNLIGCPIMTEKSPLHKQALAWYGMPTLMNAI